MGIDHDRLISAIESARANCYGTDNGSDLGRARAAAIDAYLGLNANPAPEGRSQVVDRSVYETISTMMPSLVRIFATSSEEVCKFLPVGPEDEAAAEQTTSVINHVVTQQNAWEQVCGDWLHDAMLLANGYALAYWDESDAKVRETYEGQSEDQITALVQDPDVKVIQHSQRPDEEGDALALKEHQQAMMQWQQVMPQWQQAAQQAQQQGQQPPPPPPQPQPPQPQMLHDVVIERSEQKGKTCISVLPPEHCFVSMDTPSYSLKDCPYFEYRQQRTIADIRAMGLEVDGDVNDDEDGESVEDYARDRYTENSGLNTEEGEGVMRLVWVRTIWIRTAVEDDVSRLYHVIAVGRTVLYAEPTGRIPVSSMTPQPMPHRHIGMSIAETTIDIQDVKTAVKRGGLDNMYLASNGRHVISDKVNLSDFLDARPGGVVRMLDGSLPGDGHVMPLVHPVAFDQIIGSLEYFDQERQNRTGATRYFSGTDAGAINKTASGTMALQNAASMRIEHLARVMAPAVEYLFECVQEIVSKHVNKPLTIQLRGQWITVDPQAWRTKRDVRISVGVGAGNKDSMMAQLGQIFGAQMQLGPMGIAGPEQFHATVTEMAKLAGFANPAKFWLDPSKSPPKPPPPSPEQIKAQASMAELQFSAQQDAQKLQAQQASEQQKFQAETQLEREKMAMQLQVDQSREEMQARQKQLEAQQQAELDQLKAAQEMQQAAAKLEFERWKAELDASVKLQIAGMSQPKDEDPRLAEMEAALTAMTEHMSTPAEIVRDPATGRAVGVKRGARVQRVVRDANGRAQSLQ